MADGIEKVMIAWHPAFCSAAEFDLKGVHDRLFFETEHNLSKEPLRMDLLIIKRDGDQIIDNDIARIFRRYNVVEYKSPGDSLTIDDLYKTIGYACLYKGTAAKVNAIPADELTVSLFTEGYPCELMKLLKEAGAEITEAAEGVYYVKYVGPFPLQIVVTGNLNSERHAAFKILSRSARKEDVQIFLMEAEKVTSPGDRAVVDAILQVSVSANKELYQQIKEERKMCQALRELMHDEIQEEINEAEKKGLKNGEMRGFVKCARKMCMDDDTLIKSLMEMFDLSREAALEIMSPEVA